MAGGGPTILCSPSTACSTPCTSHTTSSLTDTTYCPTSTTKPSTTIKLVSPQTGIAGKPDEDAKAHLLRKNDWMDNHKFAEGVKVQQLCLTLVGEVRLWNESCRPIALNWNGLQTWFREQNIHK